MSGTVLDGLLAQFDEDCGFIPTDPRNLAGWDLDLFSGKPMPGFDDQLADHPALVVHHEIADMAEHPVARLEQVAVHSLCAPQVSVGTFAGPVARRGGITWEST